MQTVTYPTGITNAISGLSPNYANPGDLLDHNVVSTRISPDQPDFSPVATLCRGVMNNAGQVVASGHTNLSPKTKGNFAITNGQQDITVTGLGLKFTPVGINLTVVHATSGKTEVRAFPVGLPTADGFVARLTSAVGDGTYILAFHIY